MNGGYVIRLRYFGDLMKPAIAITLIICGTVVAAMPIVAQHFEVHLADIGALCYLALATVMIVSAIAGSVFRRRADFARGFDVVPTTSG